MIRTLALSLLFLSVSLPPVLADDWQQWMGPQRDSVWREEGIVDSFPAGGLPVKWRAEVGLGYAGPAVAAGKVFVFDYLKTSGKITNNPGGRDKLEGKERVLCLDEKTGNVLWEHAYDQPYEISYAAGPRCTPTVADGKVYTLGAEGKLLCLSVDSGSVIWSRDFKEDYGAPTPIWGHAAHPLVHGEMVYCIVGGEGSVAVAFDKNNGREVWKALTAGEQGYCPPTMIEHDGTEQLLIFHPEAINSLNPKSGQVHWSVPLKPSYGMSIAAPRKQGDLVYASGIGTAAAMLKLGEGTGRPEVLWRGKTKMAVYAANSTPFMTDKMIYGTDCRSGALVAARVSDGERLWETFEPTTGDRRAGHGTAFIVKQSDRYFLFSETGDLILADLSPEGYRELDRFPLLDPTNSAFGRDVVWSHPAFANRSVYARNDKEIVCVDLAKRE